MTITQGNPEAMLPEDEFGRVIRVPDERREQALARLLTRASGPTSGQPDRAQAARFLRFAQDHAVNLEHLWAWENRQGEFDASVLAVPSPGRSAMIFASHADTGRRIARTSAVLCHACDHLRQAGTHLAQCLLDPHEHDDHTAFVGAEFRTLASLRYLERPLRTRRPPARPVWPADAQPCAYRLELRDEMLAALEATYEDTLDCPGLRGVRDTRDVLEGHQVTGTFEPSLWTLLRVAGRAAGVLLLNPAADQSSMELVYLGLAKWARGRGLGAQLLRHGLHQAAARREPLLTLAVDEANAPALAMYQREGFRSVLRRVAMIRPLRS